MKPNDIWYMWSPWLKPKKSLWDQILHLGIKKQHNKNSIIIGNGQELTELHYLHQGKLKVISTSSKGKEKPVWYIESGNIFGEVPFLDGELCYNIFESMEDCIVYTFSRQVFLEEIIPKYPEILQDIIFTLAAKTRSLSAQINDISLNSPKLRVCKMLYAMKFTSKDNTLYLSQQELGDLLAIHRVTLNHILAKLKDEGVIVDSTSKKKITVLDFDKLLKIIEEEEVYER